MKRICFQTKIADALTTLLSRYSNWTKPTTAATTHSNKMIVLSQLIVHGIQWAYDQTVRAVKIHSKDFNNFFLQNLKFAVVEYMNSLKLMQYFRCFRLFCSIGPFVGWSQAYYEGRFQCGRYHNFFQHQCVKAKVSKFTTPLSALASIMPGVPVLSL